MLWSIKFLMLTSCISESEEEGVVTPTNQLKIEEVFYAGSVPTAGIDRYYADQFIVLRNVSEQEIDIGGIGIGDIHGISGPINPGSRPDGYADDATHVYFRNLWQIPDSSPFRHLPPGGCIKIAQDAADHSPFSELNHFDAHFETYVEESEQDHDDPVVENLTSVFYTGGVDWLVTVFGPTIVLVNRDSIAESEIEDAGWTDVLRIPASGVLDTMEALMDEDSGEFKRLHPDIDAGFIHVSGTYTGESVHRNSTNGTLIDNDNSGTDFVLSTPIMNCTSY